VPQSKQADWVRNPIDAFIAAEREARGLSYRPEAPKHILLRRIHLDLTGLQPTPEDLHSFLADDAPDAYERAVDRLLDSPRYGERWGRHWMDIWRYSDWAGWTGGNQIRDSQPHIWRWRDWIIDSLNADKPYDRMLLEMLAGDELAPTDPDVLRATGYLVRNYKMLSRETWLQDTVKHTAQAFLAVTLDCARCHEHKYDPIPQEDYYRFRAFFEPHNVRIDRRPGEPDTKKDGLVRAFDAEPDAATYLFLRGDDRTPVKDNAIAPGVPAAFSGSQLQIVPVSLPLTAHSPEKLEFVIKETLAASAQTVAQAKAALETARQKAAKSEAVLAAASQGDDSTKSRDSLDAARHELVFAELAAEAAEAKHAALEATVRAERFEDAGHAQREPEMFQSLAVLATATQRWAALLEGKRDQLAAKRAAERAEVASAAATKAATDNTADKKLQDAAQKAAADLTAANKKVAESDAAIEKAKQAVLLPPTAEYTKRPLKAYPATSTGRRLALARWIADSANPLTARVAANHLWTRHFGTPLVPSVFDFGAGGRPPTHPALVDWLAAEFTDKNWSMKHMHRLILNSATYRMASTPDDAALAIDPDNRYFWRMNSRRLEAELVRDNVLWVAGQLDPKFGGPDIDHNQGLTVRRRSMYFRHAAEKQMEFMKIFDAAGVNECYERRDSVVPQQALALANSEIALVQSRLLARNLAAAHSGKEAAEFVRSAFERVLARSATTAEAEACKSFLVEQAAMFQNMPEAKGNCTSDAADGSKPFADPLMRAQENLVHALMNHNDFVTVR
jgi:hypothetical protein